MSKQKIDQVVRHALWNVHSNVCFYCSQPLEWENLQIDHIIPEHLAGDRVKLDKVIKEYNLPRNFSVTDISNLVPTHGKCNNRKSGHLFSKSATIYYLELCAGKKPAVDSEIEKLKSRKNKSQLMAKLHIAIETNLINIEELFAILQTAKESNFISKEIKLSRGFEFVDDIYDSFYIEGDYKHLYDKQVSSGPVDLVNDNGEQRTASTLQEWLDATFFGFYPVTTVDIKMSSHFTDLQSFLDALSKARPPKYSFISEPWVTVSDIDKLSPSVLQDFEGDLKVYIAKDLSVGDLARLGVIKVNYSDPYQISLEFNGIETTMREQFRADFNNDGYEDIFISGWVRAIGGTLGFGFNNVLTRFSENELLKNQLDKEEASKIQYNIME